MTLSQLDLKRLADHAGGDISGNSVNIPGPGHKEHDRSLTVTIDPGAPDGFVVYSHAGDDPLTCKDHVRNLLGLPQWQPPAKTPATEYIYKDERGQNHIRVTRFMKNREKGFFQHHWEGGKWVSGVKGIRRVPYHLPEVIAADTVFIVEGEKDADRLASLGLTATTNSGGACKWANELSPYLKDKHVIILPDNDEPGEQHAIGVRKSVQPFARSVRIVRLPDLPPKGDVSDWLNAGTKERLLELCAAAPPAAVQDDGPILTRLADVEPRPIEWLWPGRSALGKLTIIAGNPGLGKSQISMYLAATVSKGGSWVNGEGSAPLGNVIILSAEDDTADTIRPRLDAAGGDPNRVFVLEAVREEDRRRGFNLAVDIERLERVVEEMGNVRLIVIDPVTAYLGKTDSHKNAEVRAVLAPLQEMAERHQIAVVAVTHLAKATGAASTSAIGSVAFSGAARAMFLVVKDPDDEKRRLFLVAKNNIGPDNGRGLAFKVVSRGDVSAVEWEPEPVETTADEALRPKDGGGRRAGIVQAKRLIEALLATGPMSANDVSDEAEQAGIAGHALRKASNELGVIKSKRPDGWLWTLPKHAQPDMLVDVDDPRLP